MLPGKSCCFVEFDKLEDATIAFENINGKLNIAQGGKPLYLAYVNSIPDRHNATSLNQIPPGLIIIENFLNDSEASLLASLVKFDDDSGVMKHRQVRHFGYEFRYDINNVDKDKPMNELIPEECDFMWERLTELKQIEFRPDQLTVNCYKPGQGIPPHVDTHSAFEDPLISLSLISGIVMDFRHEDGRHYPVYLPKNSLTIMSGESRYDWIHGISPRKLDVIPSEKGLTVQERELRISFTFRKVLQGECNCSYKTRCDSYERQRKSVLNEKSIAPEVASNLENVHVHEVYDKIALHFSDTRHTPWPNVSKYLKTLEVGSVVLDVGCGNGKYLGEEKNVFMVRI